MNCENCNTPISGLSPVCHHCQFPYNGTDLEKKKFYGQQTLMKGQLQEAEANIKKASIALYIVAGIMLLNGLFIFFAQNSTLDLAIFGFVAICNFIFGYFVHKNPITILSAALGLITLVYILVALANGVTHLFRGVLWKIIIYTVLIKTLISSIEAVKIKKKNKALL